ncbi:mannosyltransferase family protein [Ktedonosporobacter rubrisoli]|nr:mannosyltransferase family protein [Ktedonosporobacter rubrisoli]
MTTQTADSTASIQMSWRTFIDPWWKATLAILPIFLLTRLIFLLLAYFGGVLFFVPNYWPGALTFRSVLYTWHHWDAVRFTTIATQGYPTPEYAAFFPLFPSLAHAFSVLFHRDILESTMFISNLAFLGTLIVLYRFVEVEFDPPTARRAALYLSIFPTALFFFAGYNESLFLFFLLLSFYAMRRAAWFLAGLFGGLALLSRSIGIFLALIFFCEFLRQKWPQLRQDWQERQLLRSLRLLPSLLCILLIPLGLAVFAAGLYVRFHDPLAFLHAQAGWRQGLSFPWVAPFIGIKSLFSIPLYTFANAHIIIELIAIGLFLALLILALFGPERFRRDQWPLLLYGLLALVYITIFPGSPGNGGIPYDPMPSAQRLVLEIFPGFIVLARLGRRSWFHQGYLLLALPMLAFLVLQFITGHWTI